MYERTKHWEQHLKLCPNKLNIISPQGDDLSKKDQQNFRGKDGAIGQVTICSKQNPICVPGNLVITVLGKTSKIPSKITCLVKQVQHHNLPPGIIINRCVAMTKASSVPVILINTTTQNVCIQQPLLAAELFITDQIDKIEHRANMERKRDNINLSFSHVTPNTIRVQSEQVGATPSDIAPPTSSDKPSFGPRENTNATDFVFQAEINCPSFKLNMGTEEKMTHDQQSQFLNLIYDHPEVFSLHDEDLGFCDKIKHMTPTTSHKPIYLLHHTIPPQLQGEVHKCLDTWLRQGIIRQSQSPYTSQVVIV